ncbi:MAG: endopeptidase La [Clostridia bacterium]|nr:endopeptidase La [Clostridia bacterium]
MARQTTETLPLLPLRGRVMFPDTAMSIDVGRSSSLIAVKVAADGDGRLFLCMQKDSGKEDVQAEDLYLTGTVVHIKQITRLTNGSIRLGVEGMYRAYARDIIPAEENGYMTVVITELRTVHGDESLEEAYFHTAKDILREMSGGESRLNPDTISKLSSVTDIDVFVNRTANELKCSPESKQEILESVRSVDRLRLLGVALNNELEIGRLEKKIKNSVRQSIDKGQKEFYLREQLKAIHKELGDDEEEYDELEKKIKEKKMGPEAEEKALKELSRMGRMQTSSPDYNVLRMYIDWLLDLPWGTYTTDTENLADAIKVLNEDHYGLEKIKERITEYLAVLKLTGGMNAPILCFVGPPGTGKTSVASSIARALGRKFVRMSLGGVDDESEIRGHRKTYIGAMPGRIINGIKTAGTSNPVFLLDEIDKLTTNSRGDPASALLEVLDPAQNSTFRDRYIEIPYDLSKVLFITTANDMSTIPRPLLDRMEVVQLDGYTQEEKREIAKRYLVSKNAKKNGLAEDAISFTDEAIEEIIDGYTMEAGVRSLERNIDSVCRKVAVKKASGEGDTFEIGKEDVATYLGARKYEQDAALEKDEIGAATGLAWTAVGGTTLTIEVSAMHGKGDILLTGKLGDVMKESARAAISYIRSNSETYGIADDAFETTDIHIHVPEGATPKDGPSAGITMATAILSAFTKKPVKRSVAMTGEITLRGKVLPIGGLKEKSLAAYRVGITDIIIPNDNQKDLEEIPGEVRGKLNFIPVSDVDTVFRNAIRW